MTGDRTERARAFFADRDEGDDQGEATPGRTIGRYRILRERGRGGMAIVYEAEDPTLGRRVAVKVLRDGSDERLRREAMAAARLQHPNVVTIHEVGQGFIAMELVDGPTLKEAAGALSTVQRLRVLETVSRAVAYAHGEGVVHRDLKPDNVLIDPTGRVLLSDFGIARLLDGESLTLSGSVLGTPHYMSPEQVRGDGARVGPPSDVWALGVMLHELVTGQRPFDGPSVAAVYDAIQRTDPVPLPGPLGAVAARALEKDPGRRYPSAAAFADELGRHLAGAPVQARARSRVGRALSRIRARPLPWLLGALTLVATALAVVGWAGSRAERARALASLRAQARVSLDAALELRRAGATARMRQFVAPLERAYREALPLARAPERAEAEHLMGRMHRALLDEKQALAFQERALAEDPRYAPALRERALLLSLRFGRALEAVAGEAPAAPEELERRHPELVSLRRAAVLSWQAALSGSGTERASLDRGLHAFVMGRPGDARAALAAALEADPLSQESREALGLVVWADRQADAADQERLWREREALLSAGLARDRGYAPYLLQRGQLRWTRGARRRHRGLDPSRDYDASADDFSRAIALQPTLSAAWSWRGRVNVYRGIWQLELGADPRPALAAAEVDTTRAVALDARAQHPHLWRGTARFYRGMWRAGRGEPALPDLEAAEADLVTAAALQPGASEALRWRGRNRALLAAALGRAGRNAEPTFAAAEADFVRSIHETPADEWAWIWRSTVFSERGLLRASRGEDPSDDYARAESFLDRAVALGRNQMECWKHRGLVHLFRARYREASGDRAGAHASYAAAGADLHQALTLNPTLKVQVDAALRHARAKAQELEGN